MRPQVMGCCRMVYRPPLGAWERERESESEGESEGESESEREHICFCPKYSYSYSYMLAQLLVYCNHERSF
jgi:hypothetical protein